MDFNIYLRFMLALLLVLGLIAGLTWAARRFGFGGQLTPNAGKSQRISVVEVRTLDSRRKLVLLRRDDIDHLVLLGPNQDLHLEAGIPVPRESVHPVGLATTGAAGPHSAGRQPAKLPTAERRSS